MRFAAASSQGLSVLLSLLVTAERSGSGARARSWVWLLAGLCLWLGAVERSFAQDANMASVTSVTMTVGPAGETHVLLTFDRILPPFSIITNNNPAPILGFGNARRAAGLKIPKGPHGLIRALKFKQRSVVMNITLIGVQPIHVFSKSIAGRALDLTVTPALTL